MRPECGEAVVLKGQRGSDRKLANGPSANMIHTRQEPLCPAELAPVPGRLGKPERPGERNGPSRERMLMEGTV